MVAEHDDARVSSPVLFHIALLIPSALCSFFWPTEEQIQDYNCMLGTNLAFNCLLSKHTAPASCWLKTSHPLRHNRDDFPSLLFQFSNHAPHLRWLATLIPSTISVFFSCATFVLASQSRPSPADNALAPRRVVRVINNFLYVGSDRLPVLPFTALLSVGSVR